MWNLSKLLVLHCRMSVVCGWCSGLFGHSIIADLPTFYGIKPEDLPPFGQKKCGRFLCSENIVIYLI